MTCQLSSIQKKILNLLMDKYENSLTYKGGNKVNQSFAIRPAEVYPEYTSNYASVDEVHSFEIQVRLLEEKDLSGKKLAEMVNELMKDEKRRKTLADNCRKCGKPDAADDMIAMMKEIMDRG